MAKFFLKGKRMDRQNLEYCGDQIELVVNTRVTGGRVRRGGIVVFETLHPFRRLSRDDLQGLRMRLGARKIAVNEREGRVVVKF